MTPKQITTIRDSWAKVKPIAPQAAQIFYDTLFEINPDVKPLFPSDVTEQGKKLMAMLDTAIGLLDKPDKLIPALQDLGKKHVAYGVKDSHYNDVGAALLKTLEIGLEKEFTATVKRAWTAMYKEVSSTMIEASHTSTNTTKDKENAMDKTAANNNDLAVRLQGALDQSSTAFMMIDRDFNVTYVNESTMALLTKHEATFQKKWPVFKADKDEVIGTCIDVFHVKPEHQRKLLSDPNNLPWKTDIQIEHLKIELNVTAINDADGNYIGNSLEWQDVTEIRAQENQAVQLQGAVDQSNTPSMFIDRDFNITYANQATMRLLKEHEATFQKKWPGFKATEEVIMGSMLKH